jgi:pSer/pThr/pTyr-binding forkhead associated (FHA) protein
MRVGKVWLIRHHGELEQEASITRESVSAMRFRLRYLQHDLELSEGEFVLGRSAECQLSLDDPLVSRRHALLLVTREGVTIEDLQSRNGITVNGHHVVGKMSLSSGNKIGIGSQELILLLAPERAERELLSTTQAGQRTMPRLPATPPPLKPQGMPPLKPLATPPAGPTVPPPPPPAEAPPPGDASTERRTDAFKLLGSVADKALAMGRAEEAERLLSTALADVIDASRTGRRISPSLLDVAARLAAKLATATSKGAWVDYVVELYDIANRLCPAPVIDELYSALRKVSAIDLARLRAYVSHLRERQATLGPADKFLLQRIEGLERLAALR